MIAILLVLFATAYSLQPTACFAQGGQATALRVDPATKVHRALLYDGANVGAQIAACLAGVQAQGGGTCDARGLRAHTWTANPFVGINSNTPITLRTGDALIQWDHAAIVVDFPSNFRWVMDNTVFKDSNPTGIVANPLPGVLSFNRFAGNRIYQTTGAITTGTNTVTVASATGLTVGAMLGIVGAAGGNSNQRTTVNQEGGIELGATSFTVTSTTGWDLTAPGIVNYVLIGTEIYSCTGGTATSFTGCIPGALGTTDATHIDGSNVDAVGVLLSQIIDIAGTTVTLADNASKTVSASPVYSGVTNVSIEGKGIWDGNQNLATDSRGMAGLVIAFSTHVTIGSGITFKNFDHGGIVLTASSFCNIGPNSFEGIGKPGIGIGSDVWLFENATDNFISTGTHHDGNYAVFVDDRSGNFTRVSGPSDRNVIHLGPVRGLYTHGINIEGSSKNTIYAGYIEASVKAIEVVAAQWTTSEAPANNTIFFGQLTSPATAIHSFNFSSAYNRFVGGHILSGTVSLAATDTASYIAASGNQVFDGLLPISLYAVSARRSEGNAGYPDIYGDETHPLVIGGKSDGTGTVGGGATSLWELYAVALKRSGGNTSYPDIYGDGTHPLVIAGKMDGSGTVRFGATTTVEIPGTQSLEHLVINPGANYGWDDYLRLTDGTKTARIGIGQADGRLLFRTGGNSFGFWNAAGTIEIGTFLDGGFLGLTTTEPLSRLHLSAASNDGVIIANTLQTPGSRNWRVFTSGKDLEIVPTDDANSITAYALRLTRAGNASIGGAQAVQKLDVYGNIGISGTEIISAAGVLSNVTADMGIITSGTVALARGGTAADLSATGGATKVLAQDAAHAISARDLIAADIPNLAGEKITSGAITMGGGGGTGSSNLRVASGVALDAQWTNYGRWASGVYADAGNLYYATGAGNKVATLSLEAGVLIFRTGTSTGVNDPATVTEKASIDVDGVLTATASGSIITSGTVADARVANTLLRGSAGESLKITTLQMSSGTANFSTGLSTITGCTVSLYYATTPVAQTLSYGKSGGTATVYSSDPNSAYWVTFICTGT